jgi:hypothetical protein
MEHHRVIKGENACPEVGEMMFLWKFQISYTKLVIKLRKTFNFRGERERTY